jgi:ATP-dependent DNA helicase RecQ
LKVVVSAEIDIHATLRRYWGYSEFRPKQEQIVRAILEGRDTAVVMPTGGGKSLCYQLPAVAMGGTAIVISPLIALMKDQVESLKANGIAAAFINSSLDSNERRRIMQQAARGVFRLLYLSPERLAMAETMDWLKRFEVSMVVIDEAHCISEWGHEFRPEYRQLAALRHQLPEVPVAAFTASATQRVRHDILSQLAMRDPARFIVSFRRPNLRYSVKEVDSREQQKHLLAAIKAYDGESVVVYASTIKDVHATVDLLRAKKIEALPYHGKMESHLREKNQEQWMNDEVRVVVGTLAFGLGINKPAVRAVVHLNLPKSLEQYYQEAGRAGRDGDEADCLLLWQKRDTALLAHFINQIEDPAEKRNAWQRYREITGYVKGDHCRHLTICEHFGERPKWNTCEMCDFCAGFPDWMSTKLAEVTPKVKKSREKKATSPDLQAIDTQLAEKLRSWRKQMSKKSNVPSFIVLNDVTLENLARVSPRNREQLLSVSGIGQRKADQYGDELLQLMAEHRQSAPTSVPSTTLRDQVLYYLSENRSLPEIVGLTQKSMSQVVAVVCDAMMDGQITYQAKWVAQDHWLQISKVVGATPKASLAEIKAKLPSQISYDAVRLVVTSLNLASRGTL